MQKNIEEYYRTYQKKSDPIIKKTYLELIKKSEDKSIGETQLLEVKERMTAIWEVIQERELKIKKYDPNKSIAPKKENTKNPFIDGGKAILIGVLVFVLSLGLLDFFDGNKIFLIGIIIGSFKILEGIITMAVGFYFKITNN